MSSGRKPPVGDGEYQDLLERVWEAERDRQGLELTAEDVERCAILLRRGGSKDAAEEAAMDLDVDCVEEEEDE